MRTIFLPPKTVTMISNSVSGRFYHWPVPFAGGLRERSACPTGAGRCDGCGAAAEGETPPALCRNERRQAFGARAEEGIFYLFLGAVSWVPFWYGSNTLFAWGLNALLFPGLALLYELCVLSCGRRHAVGIRTLAFPAALFAAVVLWILFQEARFGPRSWAQPIWGLAGRALGAKLAASISVDREMARLALLRLLTAATAFWFALQLCRDKRRAILLLRAFAATAVVYAVLGLVAAKSGPLPWLSIPAEGGWVSSTFVDRDSFATYAGLGLVAITALLLRHYSRAAAAPFGWQSSAFSFLEATAAGGALLFLGAFLLLAALLLTGSRGGIAASGLALLFFGLLFAGRTDRAGRAGRTGGGKGGAKAALFFLLLCAGAAFRLFGGAFFGSVEKKGFTDASRMAVYVLSLRSIRDAPWLGYGYGSFAEVFPIYRDRSLSVVGTWAQAHDTYLELFQGLGLLFGSLLILCVGLLVWRSIRAARTRRAGTVVPAVAASAALLVASHAVVDFSLQIEAVSLSFASLLGAGVAQAQSSRISLAD